MAALTAHSFDIKIPELKFRRDDQRMAGQALGRRRRIADSQKAAHALGHGIVEAMKRFEVGIFGHPGAVFVLQDARQGTRLHASVASRRAARTGADIFPGNGHGAGLSGCLLGAGTNDKQNTGENHAQCNLAPHPRFSHGRTFLEIEPVFSNLCPSKRQPKNAKTIVMRMIMWTIRKLSAIVRRKVRS